MKIVLTLISLMFVTAAFAEDETPTYFEKLGTMYESALLPSVEKISNIAWSGRCFTSEESKQNEASAGGYLIREFHDEDVGPINDLQKYEAFSYSGPAKEKPNYYDDKDLKFIVENTLLSAKAYDVKILEKSIQLELAKNSYSNLRTSGQYLIEQLSVLAEDGSRKVYARCYYFISHAK